jgi:endoglucanase
MKDLITKFVECAGPSGYESRIREAIKAEVQPFSSSITTDPLGNLIVTIGKKSKDGKRIMLAAHMDEIGVIVTHVDKKGFARFSNLGGVFPQNCLAAHVTFLNGVRGVIGADRLEDPGKQFSLENFYIDCGTTSREDCPLKVGDVAVFDRPVIDMGKRLVSKALDNRISCALLVEVIKQIKETPHELVFVFSTQEEVGMRGVTGSAYSVDPDIALSVDVTSTGDVPTGKMEVSLGKGPAVKVKDQGMISDPRIVDWMVKTAEAAGLPYQLEILAFGTTDARAIQLTRGGVPSGCLSIPTRYIHSPAEMIDMDDVDHSLALLLALLRNPVVIQ